MDPSLRKWLRMAGIPMGRRQHALEKLLVLAIALGYLEFAEFLRTAIEGEKDYRNLVRDAGTIKPRSKLKEISLEIGTIIVWIYDSCEKSSRIFANKPSGELAQEILRTIFKDGVAGITNNGYVEKSKEIGSIINLLETDFAEHVKVLLIAHLVVELKELQADFSAGLAKSRKNKITGDDLRTAKVNAQNNFYSALAQILGLFHLETEEHIKARKVLLEPIYEQIQAVKAFRKQRRKVRDIDPETGELIVE